MLCFVLFCRDDVMDESEFEEECNSLLNEAADVQARIREESTSVSGLKKPHVPADSHIEEPEIVELERRTEANKRKEANLC